VRVSCSVVLTRTLHRGIGVVRACEVLECEVKVCEVKVCEAKVCEAEAAVSDMVSVDRRSGREEFLLRMILTGTGSVAVRISISGFGR